MRRWIPAFVILCMALFNVECRAAALASDTLPPDAVAMLDEDPDRLFYVAIVTPPGKEKAAADALHLSEWDAYTALHVVFSHVRADVIQAWPTQPDVTLIDVIDDTQAFTVHRMLQLLEKVALYDDLGTYRLSVLNISIGPPRALVNRGVSGERAITAALKEIVQTRGIPVVMSIGNDGPIPGFVNPWATAPGVFVVAATDRDGRFVWDQSSRFSVPLPSGIVLFAAQGIDTIGARAHCRPKTDAERAADLRAGLAEVVGAENVPCYDVESGTSFAAAAVTRMMCLLYQSVSLLSMEISGSSPVNMSWPLDQFIRGYIDSGIDRSLPIFRGRNADDQRHNGPMLVQLQASQKNALLSPLLDHGIDIRVRWTPDTVRALLTRAAEPVPGATPEQVGGGFLSWDGVSAMLRGLTLAQLVDMLTPPDHPSRRQWIESLGDASTTPVFLPNDLDRIDTYCQIADVGLELPIYPEHQR